MKRSALRMLCVSMVLLALPTMASAASYVCQTSRLGGVEVASSYGKFGSLLFTVYSEPACAGTYQGAYTFCTEGASYVGCSSSVYALYTDASLAALSSDLTEAAREGQRVSVGTGTCFGGTAGCAIRVYFYGN